METDSNLKKFGPSFSSLTPVLSKINDHALFPLVRIIRYLFFSFGNIGAKTTGNSY